VTGPEFEELFERLKTWGRWGDDDELGALRHIDDAKVAEACALPRHGKRVSLARPVSTLAGPDNMRPALHHMTRMGERGAEEPTTYTDFIGIDYHSKCTHLDALPHMAYRGQFYNGRPASPSVTAAGAGFAAVTTLAGGIVTRGVLLDAPRARGLDWIDPPFALGPGELREAADRLGVEIRRGDAVLVRTGQPLARRRQDPLLPEPATCGLHPYGMAWLAEREIAVLGGDGNNDVRPSLVSGVGAPAHVLALVALGIPLLDSLDLEALSTACAEAGRFEFLLVVAPLVIPGGTGSPVNPVAVL
jgi:kynurenine formamidase